MTTPFEGGTQAETRQGISAADAARAQACISSSLRSALRIDRRAFRTSTASTRSKSTSPGSASRHDLAPVSFMENLYFAKEQLAKGIYAAALPPTRTLAQVAVADIGAVAVRVLEDPGRFAGKRFDLAGDELTGNDAVAILSRITGRSFTYYQIPLDVIRQRMGEDAARMYEWLDRVGYTVDRAALRLDFPTSPSTTSSRGRRHRIGMRSSRAPGDGRRVRRVQQPTNEVIPMSRIPSSHGRGRPRCIAAAPAEDRAGHADGTSPERACPDGAFSGGACGVHIAARSDRRARHLRSEGEAGALNLATAATVGNDYMIGIASRFARMNGWTEAQIVALADRHNDGRRQDRRADPRGQGSGCQFGKPSPTPRGRPLIQAGWSDEHLIEGISGFSGADDVHGILPQLRAN